MAKKDKKKKDKQKGSDAADAVEAVRSAVERTFQATTEGAAGTSKRTRQLVDEVAHAASRIRETIEDLKILEDVRGLRSELDALARRVAALEVPVRNKRAPAAAPSRPAPAKRAAKTTAKRSTAKRSATAKRAASSTTAKRTAAKRTAKTRAKSRAKSRAKTAPRAKPSGSS